MEGIQSNGHRDGISTEILLPGSREASVSPMPPARKPELRPPLTIGWDAARANILPGLVLQALMLALLLAYYLSPAVAATLHSVAEFKRTHGLVFVVIATILAASILPEIFLVLFFQHGQLRVENFRNLLFTAPVWGLDGITVDYLYRGLAALLGDEVRVGVVAAKICIDQFGYNVLFAAPYGVIAYQWKNSGFSRASLRRSFTFEFYREKVVPTLFTTWAVWIPLMAMIYSLPLGLQFPLFSVVLTFWVLLLTYMTNCFAGKTGHFVPASPPKLATAR